MAKKQTGLGTASYFEDVPDLQRDDSEPVQEQPATSKSKPAAKPKQKRIRRTYALYEQHHLALEQMKLQARIEGEKITTGQLLEAAIELLAKKRGVEIKGN